MKSPSKAKASEQEGFTEDERAAMRERAKETKGSKHGGGAAEPDGEQEVLAKIAEMKESDRAMAERLHAIIKSNAPDLSAKTWYGMPAYAKAGTTICFFQPAHKFKTRYATLGFSDKARLDDGDMWPTAFALMKLTAAEEAQIIALLKKATS